MLNDVWLTRWRNEPIIPDNYEDLPSLLRLAKRLRNEIIEFDWVFNKEEIIKLGEAVFEVGKGLQGRYRCFYWCILEAVNNALEKGERLYYLPEPKRSEEFNFQIRCIKDGNLFHLQGHASFDLIFSLAQDCAVSKASAYKNLHENVKKKLMGNMGMLGWDTRVLKEGRYDAFRTKLYGMQLKKAREEVNQSDLGPALQLDIQFEGPFSALDNIPGCRCVFKETVGNNKGVYLWTVNVKGQEIPYYIGQTRRSFIRRTAEHIKSMLSAEYFPRDAAALAQGKKMGVESIPGGIWPYNLPYFLGNWETVIPNIINEIKLIRFHLAPISVPESCNMKLSDLLKRVEGAIGRYLKKHPDSQIHELFSPEIKLPDRIPGDRRLRIRISSEVPIKGLPSEIIE